MTGLLVNCARHPAAAITSNTGWTGLDRIRAMPLVDAAISDRIGSAENPVTVTMTVGALSPLSAAAVCGVNLEQDAWWRLEGLDGAGQSLFTTGYQQVVPSLLAWEEMSFGAENMFRGDLPRDQWVIGNPAIYAVFETCTPAMLRWSFWGGAFRPDGSPANYYRIGFAPAGDGIPINRAVGSIDKIDPQAEVTRLAGGGAAIDPGQYSRNHVIDLSLLDRAERNRLAILRRDVGADLPVIWIPGGDPAENFMWGGVKRISGSTDMAWRLPQYVNSQIVLEDWI